MINRLHWNWPHWITYAIQIQQQHLFVMKYSLAQKLLVCCSDRNYECPSTGQGDDGRMVPSTGRKIIYAFGSCIRNDWAWLARHFFSSSSLLFFGDDKSPDRQTMSHFRPIHCFISRLNLSMTCNYTDWLTALIEKQCFCFGRIFFPVGLLQATFNHSTIVHVMFNKNFDLFTVCCTGAHRWESHSRRCGSSTHRRIASKSKRNINNRPIGASNNQYDRFTSSDQPVNQTNRYDNRPHVSPQKRSRKTQSRLRHGKKEISSNYKSHPEIREISWCEAFPTNWNAENRNRDKENKIEEQVIPSLLLDSGRGNING